MASLVTHPIIPIAAALALGPSVIGWRLLWLGVFATMIADADVIAFLFGIPYASSFGHRGFTHSVIFALTIAGFAAHYARSLERQPRLVFAFVFAAAVSHPLLDAFTNGGFGVALAWPINDVRVFAPWRPIEVSPIGLAQFFDGRPFNVLFSEFVWVWIPASAIALAGIIVRRVCSLDAKITPP